MEDNAVNIKGKESLQNELITFQLSSVGNYEETRRIK